METYTEYLQQHNYAPRTITGHLQILTQFTLWIQEDNYPNLLEINHKDILAYVEYLASKKLAPSTQNNILGSLRLFYRYLQEQGEILYNPVKKLSIKGTVKKIIHQPLTEAQLDQLYTDYVGYIQQKNLPIKNKQIYINRSIVLTGLLIYQALHSGELQRIRITDIDLTQSTIYIPSSKKTNSRKLPLSPKQIIHLYHYLEALPITQTKLITHRASNLTNRIVQELKGINPQIKNSWHLRANIILNWLKHYNKRQVQYKLGHKWISSTEQYEIQNLEKLTNQLAHHHPLNKLTEN